MTIRTFTVQRIRWQQGRQMRMKALVRRFKSLSMHQVPTKSCLCVEPPKVSTLWRKPTDVNLFRKAMKSLFPRSYHHANIVPWQQLAKEKKAKLLVIPINDNGEIILEEYERLLSPRTKICILWACE